jgi:hypothetical protein
MAVGRFFLDGDLTQTEALRSIKLLSLPDTVVNLIVKVFRWSLFVSLFVTLASSKRAKKPDGLLYDFSMISLAVLLVSPVVWVTHLVVLVIPISYMLFKSLTAKDIRIVCLIAVMIVLLSTSLIFSADFEFANRPTRDHFRAYAAPLLLALIAYSTFVFKVLSRAIAKKV